MASSTPDWQGVLEFHDEGGAFAAVIDEDFVLRAATPRAQGLLGWKLEDVVGRSVADLIHPADLERALTAFGELRRYDGIRPPDVYRILAPSGRAVAFDVTGRNLDEPAGALVFQLRELSDRRRAELLALEQIELIEKLSKGAAIEDCLSTLANLAERHIDDSVALLLVGDTLACTAECPPDLLARHRQAGADLTANRVEASLRGVSIVEERPDSLEHWQPVIVALRDEGIRSVVTTPIHDAEGRAIGHLEVLRRSSMGPTNAEFSVHELVARLAGLVVGKHEQTARLLQVVHEDPLTGLGNRRQLDRRLTQVAAQGERYAVGVIDLDQFSWVNNNLGHRQGDSVLSTVADRLGDVVGHDVEVTRFGGDEFVVIVTGEPTSEGLVELGRGILRSLDGTITLASGPRRITASIGFSISTVKGENPHEVLVRADAAMYAAKRDGGDGVRVYDADVGRTVRRRMMLADELPDALRNGELSLAYQPVFDLDRHALVAVEALVRWQHPRHGLVGPDDFIPIAESSSTIVDLDHWVLETAHSQLCEWQRRRPVDSPLDVWVNVTARTLDQPGFADHVLAITGGDPDPHLGIELTERTDFRHQEIVVDNVTRLRQAGLGVAIDDFGTGQGSLERLGELDVSHLKIDQSFVAKMDQSRRYLAIVQAVLMLADTMGAGITAEGIETVSQLTTLRAMDCAQGQGFLFCHPEMPANLEARFGEGLHVPWLPAADAAEVRWRRRPRSIAAPESAPIG
ncbi:MAG: EAL domain-containing protein [Acidimicrobiia bacterium]|nr:EAL domain-containing protein [Acidimicrobiia bacterium]